SASLGASPSNPVAVRGQFDQLNAGADKDYEILNDVYGSNFKVLRLTQPLTGAQRLAVSYQRRAIDANGNGVGAFENLGGQTIGDSDGDTSRVMRLVRVPPDLIGAAGAGLDARFDSTRVIAPARELELKNFYQLAGQRIDPASLKITIRQSRFEPPKTAV